MLNTRREIEDAFASDAGPLAGRSVGVTDVGFDDEVAFSIAVDAEEDDADEIWRTARSALGMTGRWPVMTSNVVDFNRFPYGHQRRDVPDDEDVSPRAICARARSHTAEQVIAEMRQRIPDWPKAYEDIKHELHKTEELFGNAPFVPQVVEVLGEEPGEEVLEKWLFDWERETGLSPVVDNRHLDWSMWYRPDPSDEPKLLLLPTDVGWEVPAYLSFDGAQGPGRAERLIAVLRDWNQCFGAELVAHHGTLLRLDVLRPPETLDEAWGVAWDHEFTASCTRTMSVRHYARSLVRATTWILHDRP